MVRIIWNCRLQSNQTNIFMNDRPVKLSLALSTLFLLMISCSQETKTVNSFLIRNNHVQIDEFRKQVLEQTNTKRLYIKFFDVVFNEWQKRPLPLVQVEFDTASLKWIKDAGIEIVPVVYINNDLVDKVVPEHINALADRIMLLLKTRLEQFYIANPKIVHIDCDWSISSQEKYFDMLRYFQTMPFFLDKQISVAVRPEQIGKNVKFGTPPVKRAVFTLDKQNEEFDPSLLNSYAIPLDISLPLFNDPLVYRNDQLMGSISGLPDSLWKNDRVVRIAGEQPVSIPNPDHFEIIKDTVVKQHYFKSGDKIEYIVGDTAMLNRLIVSIQNNLKSPERTVILNQLDSVKIRQYSNAQLKAAFESFNKK